MNIEAITLAIASVGAVIVALFGVYRASSGAAKIEPTVTAGKDSSAQMLLLMDQHITKIKSIEEEAKESVQVMHETKRLLEAMSNYSHRSVGQLENISRTMDRVEANQNKLQHTLETIKNNEEAVVHILGQIREFMRMLHAQQRA